MIRTYLVACALLLGACGEDDPPPAPARAPTTPGGAKAAAAKKGPVKQLTPMRRIEDRVACPTPSDAKKCDLKAPVCGPNQYCLAAGKDTAYCGPCPERDAIRHVFKPRDFQGADIRDPFLSLVVAQPGLNMAPETAPRETTQKCTRPDQFVFASRNYMSLKLIGIVSQGTQRKALMADIKEGRVVKRGDCVGREKAFVKDIGAGYVTFTVEPTGKGDPSEYSVQLWPSAVSLSDPDAVDPGAAASPTTPTVTPPSAIPAPSPAPETTPGTTTTIIQDKPSTTTTTVPAPTPQQAPTQLKP